MPAALLLLALACKPEPTPETCEGTPLPDLDPVTTRTVTVLADPPLAGVFAQNPAFPEGLAAAREAGLGGWSEGPGEDWLVRDDLAPGAGAGERRSLALILHQSDAQIADAESPIRMAGADAAGVTQSAARPQELYLLHALDALLATADAIDTEVPIDFALATGDNADNCQGNELEWFRDVWDGVPFRPDSGDPDDQTDGDCNDPLAQFRPVGATFPWYAVSGNHDVLVQGNFLPGPYEEDALRDDAVFGTRDLSLPGGPLTFDAVPDGSRRVLDRSGIASVLLDSPETPGPRGHGLTDANIVDGTVSFSVRPIPDVPIRLIALDANPNGPIDGILSVREREDVLIPALEAAQAAGELIIVTSHYALSTLRMEDGGEVGDVLAAYDTVVLVLAGHWHHNVVRPVGNPGDPAGYWEIIASSTADWPLQGRLVELVLNGDDTLSIITTVFDVPAPAGTMAARARELTAIDLQSGWRLSDGSGFPEDRNVELIQPLPAGFSTTAGTPGVRSESLP